MTNPLLTRPEGDYTIVEVAEEVAIGDLDPEVIITPGVFVDSYFITGHYVNGRGQQ